MFKILLNLFPFVNSIVYTFVLIYQFYLDIYLIASTISTNSTPFRHFVHTYFFTTPARYLTLSPPGALRPCTSCHRRFPVPTALLTIRLQFPRWIPGSLVLWWLSWVLACHFASGWAAALLVGTWRRCFCAFGWYSRSRNFTISPIIVEVSSWISKDQMVVG